MSAVVVTTEIALTGMIEKAVRGVLADFIAPAKQNEAEDELLTIKQAAELLSLEIASVYGLVYKSAIPYMKPTGKRLYFSKKELTEWLKNSRRKTAVEIEAQADSYLNSKKKGGVA